MCATIHLLNLLKCFDITKYDITKYDITKYEFRYSSISNSWCSKFISQLQVTHYLSDPMVYFDIS